MRRTIFISYRRRDSAPWARLLHDRLTRDLRTARIFMDVEDIPIGGDFPAVINTTIAKASALIVLIGPRWHERLLEPSDVRPDHVRLEIVAALAAGLAIFPVLVDGATMPEPEVLPEDVRGLGRVNAIAMSNDRWRDDYARLLKALKVLTARTIRRRDIAYIAGGIGLASAGLLLSTFIPTSTSIDTTAVATAALAVAPPPPTSEPQSSATGTSGDETENGEERAPPPGGKPNAVRNGERGQPAGHSSAVGNSPEADAKRPTATDLRKFPSFAASTFAPSGAVADGPTEAKKARTGQSLDFAIRLEPRRCYTFVAVGTSNSHRIRLSLTVIRPSDGSVVELAGNGMEQGSVVGEKANCFAWREHSAAKGTLTLTVVQGAGWVVMQRLSAPLSSSPEPDPPQPQYPTQQPQYPAQQPQYPTQQPQYPTQQPQYPQPQYPTQQPQYPQQRSTQPQQYPQQQRPIYPAQR